jgi:hypothetical protein
MYARYRCGSYTPAAAAGVLALTAVVVVGASWSSSGCSLATLFPILFSALLLLLLVVEVLADDPGLLVSDVVRDVFVTRVITKE